MPLMELVGIIYGVIWTLIGIPWVLFSVRNRQLMRVLQTLGRRSSLPLSAGPDRWGSHTRKEG